MNKCEILNHIKDFLICTFTQPVEESTLCEVRVQKSRFDGYICKFLSSVDAREDNTLISTVCVEKTNYKYDDYKNEFVKQNSTRRTVFTRNGSRLYLHIGCDDVDSVAIDISNQMGFMVVLPQRELIEGEAILLTMI